MRWDLLGPVVHSADSRSVNLLLPIIDLFNICCGRTINSIVNIRHILSFFWGHILSLSGIYCRDTLSFFMVQGTLILSVIGTRGEFETELRQCLGYPVSLSQLLSKQKQNVKSFTKKRTEQDKMPFLVYQASIFT